MKLELFLVGFSSSIVTMLGMLVFIGVVKGF